MASAWFPIRAPKPGARARLFCFGYAGGGASLFFPWAKELLLEPIEVCPAQLPGRESRLREAPVQSIPEAVEHLFREIQPLLDLPFAIFGHSLGSTIAFELIRRLRNAGAPLPLHFFASSGQPPHIPRDEPPLHALPREPFIEQVEARYHGIPPELKQHAELMELFLPILRADLRLLETYQYAHESPLPLPITAWGGESDDLLPGPLLERWREQTSGSFDSQLLPGGHFHLKETRGFLIARVKAVLSERSMLAPG